MRVKRWALNMTHCQDTMMLTPQLMPRRLAAVDQLASEYVCGTNILASSHPKTEDVVSSFLPIRDSHILRRDLNVESLFRYSMRNSDYKKLGQTVVGSVLAGSSRCEFPAVTRPLVRALCSLSPEKGPL